MSASLAELNAAVAVNQAQRAEQERAEVQAARERLTPLEARLAQALVAIPLEIQRKFRFRQTSSIGGTPSPG